MCIQTSHQHLKNLPWWPVKSIFANSLIVKILWTSISIFTWDCLFKCPFSKVGAYAYDLFFCRCHNWGTLNNNLPSCGGVMSVFWTGLRLT